MARPPARIGLGVAALAIPFASLLTTPAAQALEPATPSASVPATQTTKIKMLATSGNAYRAAFKGKVDTVGLTWSGAVPSKVGVRTRGADGTWSAWLDLHVHDTTGSDPVWVGPQREAQFRATFLKPPKKLEAVAIYTPTSPALSARTAAKVAAAEEEGVDEYGQKIITRLQWGADERLNLACTPPAATQRLDNFFVHHTAGSNNYTQAQVPSILRGIHSFHTKGRGWCDVGYNFLVDKWGTAYEGRRGGIGALTRGAHVAAHNDNSVGISLMGNYDTVKPTAAMLEGVAKLVAWKARAHYVPVKGTVTRKGKVFQRISGHRDGGSTACPGEHVYAQLPKIRVRAAALEINEATSPSRAAWQAAKMGIVTRGETKTSGGSIVRGPAGVVTSHPRHGTTVIKGAAAASVEPAKTGWPVAGANNPVGQIRTSKGALVTGVAGKYIFLADPVFAAWRQGAAADLGTPVSSSNKGRNVTFTAGNAVYAAGRVETTRALNEVTVTGRGFGHGRGMSQWGAQNAALKGLSTASILQHYYPGTTLASDPRRVIRVKLSGTTSSTVVLAQKGLHLREAATGRMVKLPEGATQWRAHRDGSRTTVTRLVGGKWKPSDIEMSGDVVFRGGGPVEVLQSGKFRSYRGYVRATASGAVNRVGLDAYLRGVVASEMPSSWNLQALGAQAVAARTYATAAIERASAGSLWDICDSTACQVYSGALAEKSSTDSAIRATAGQVLRYRGKTILAEYSASNGGRSLASNLPYQVDKADPYDRTGSNPHKQWSVKISAAQLRSAFPSVGTPLSVEVVARTGQGWSGGRADTVRVTGATGTTTVSGDRFRSMFALKSRLVAIA